MATPKIEIDFEQLEEMCKIMCTQAEICAILNIDSETLTDRIKEKYAMDYRSYYKWKSAEGRRSLRRHQFKAAERGNSAMLIFLGKVILEQQEPSNALPSIIISERLQAMPESELRALAGKYAAGETLDLNALPEAKED